MSLFDFDFMPSQSTSNGEASKTNGDGASILPPNLFTGWLGGDSTVQNEQVNSDFANDNFSKARSFEEIIKMVKVAEDRLAAAGLANTPEEVVWILRGIYYGTEWSMDYDGEANEGSWIRNAGFDYYTKHRRPDDPREALGDNLFNALKASPEVKDPNGMHTDFGHIVIGAETQDWAGKNVPTGTGGTGNEVVTWLGDLGGGAGMLSMIRGGINGKARPSASAMKIFNDESNYGGSINVEGDIAGTVGITLEDGKSFSQVLEEYLVGKDGQGGGNFDKRAALFLVEIGGLVVNNILVNKAALINKLTDKFVQFGQFYSLTRSIDKTQFNVTPHTLRSAGKHMIGSANEVATIFVNMLENGMNNPGKMIVADSSMDPGVTAPDSVATSQYEAAAMALEAKEEGEKWARDKYNEHKDDIPDPGDLW